MMGLTFTRSPEEPLTALFLGAHCDDIEIGCGGTVLELATRFLRLSVHWVVLSSNDARAAEAAGAARRFLEGVPESSIAIERFRDGYFPYEGGVVKDYFEQLKAKVTPDVIFTHFHEDWHQDHRIVSELTWNTWRDHLILEYEVPKYDPDIGSPNFFIPISEAHARSKCRYLREEFGSQRNRHWFTDDTFLAIMRLRGLECRATESLAEAFYCRKTVFQ